MTIKLRCQDYGFDCDFILEGPRTTKSLEKLRNHFEEKHGIDYTTEVITQMILNRGYSLNSFKKE
jgi:predicted small metal-binding protein